jgi:thiol-disulfide isomerase/thioredoxin
VPTASAATTAVALAIAVGACGSPSGVPVRTGGLAEYHEATRTHGSALLVVNHFALWCGPCMEEMPYLLDLARRAPEGVRFLGVSWDLTVERSEVEASRKLSAFVRDREVPFPILLYEDEPWRLLEESGVESNALPFTLFFGSRGELLHRVEGALLDEPAREGFEAAIASYASGGR